MHKVKQPRSRLQRHQRAAEARRRERHALEEAARRDHALMMAQGAFIAQAVPALAALLNGTALGDWTALSATLDGVQACAQEPMQVRALGDLQKALRLADAACSLPAHAAQPVAVAAHALPPTPGAFAETNAILAHAAVDYAHTSTAFATTNTVLKDAFAAFAVAEQGY